MQTMTDWSRGLGIEVGGDDVVSHTGTVITRMLSDRTGLTGALSDALARPDVVHDRGRVLADVALAIADGATSISDIDVLGDQRRVFGPVASTSTTWRALNEIDERALKKIAAARNQTRKTVWSLIEARYGSIRACHDFCVSPGWSIIGSPFGRIEGAFCDEGYTPLG